MANWRRITGAAGLVVGATAAGAGAIVAAERIAVSRIRSRAGHPLGDEPFGTLRGRELTVLAHDGVPLHVEINGPDAAPVTIVFCHGYTVNQDCWHFQRRDLAQHRLVFWDQRDHGRSGRSASGSATIDELGADLKAVIDAAAPGPGPVVLVGHSMGGMTIMALAEQHPGMFASKVAGAVLISTAARGLDRGSPWMPPPVRPLMCRTLPCVLNGVAKGGGLVERGRKASADLAFLGTRVIGFGDGEVSPATVGFLEQMVRDTPIEVVARFCQALLTCDMRGSLATLGRVPVVVMVGEKDRLVAPRLGIELAAEIPGAQLIWIPGGGHALILERPDLVSDTITAMLAKLDAGGDPASLGMTGGQQVTVETAAGMRALGRRLAGLLRAGDLVILSGPLGAGKTTLVQGIGEGLGVRGPVTSPTFVIARVHPSLTGGPDLVHADAYRLASPAEVDDLDLDEAMDSSVTVVEWGGGLAEGLAADRLEVTITPVEATAGPGGETRSVCIAGHGGRWTEAGHSAFLALSGTPEGL